MTEIQEPNIIYKGKYKYKKECDCGIVNPVTEWVGGPNLVITRYECPNCKVITRTLEY